MLKNGKNNKYTGNFKGEPNSNNIKISNSYTILIGSRLKIKLWTMLKLFPINYIVLCMYNLVYIF